MLCSITCFKEALLEAIVLSGKNKKCFFALSYEHHAFTFDKKYPKSMLGYQATSLPISIEMVSVYLKRMGDRITLTFIL